MINFAKVSNFGKVCDWQSSYGKIVNKYTKRRELTICHYIDLLICYFADLQIKRKPPHTLLSQTSPKGDNLQK